MAKGVVIRSGLKGVTWDGNIIQDKNLEYDPKEYAVLMKPTVDGKADVVQITLSRNGNNVL
jgi:hypothetical protein